MRFCASKNSLSPSSFPVNRSKAVVLCLFVRLWLLVHMWRLCWPYMFLFFSSFGALGDSEECAS